MSCLMLARNWQQQICGLNSSFQPCPRKERWGTAVTFDAFSANDFGGGGQPSYGGFGGGQPGGTTRQSSYGDFGGYGSRASAEFFGGGQSSNGGFGGGVSGGAQSFNHYQV